MKVTYAALLLLIVTPAVAETMSPDETAVVDALKTMYVAAASDDLDKFRTVAAPDFYSFDGGKRFTGDELMALIQELHAAGNTYVWTVNEPEVHVDGNTAWITYVNRGSLENASGKKDLAWLESAVLRKHADTWLIHFFHSTRAP